MFRYYQKIPEDLPELEIKATFGLAAPIPFNMPDVHPIFTEEAYKDFQIPENATPRIVSSCCHGNYIVVTIATILFYRGNYCLYY